MHHCHGSYHFASSSPFRWTILQHCQNNKKNQAAKETFSSGTLEAILLDGTCMKYNVDIEIAVAIPVKFKGSSKMFIFHIFNWNIFLSNHLAGHSHYRMKQCFIQDSYMAIWGILLCECSIWECMSKPWVNHCFVQEMFHERSVFPDVNIK